MQDFTNYSPNKQPGDAYSQVAVGSEAIFFQQIYTWMFAGLALTAGIAYVLSGSQAFQSFLLSSSFVLIGAMLVQLGLVFYLSARIHQMAPGQAKIIFLVYSAATGATFSTLLLVYPSSAIVKAFVCTAGVYGAMAAYGLMTKRSLQAWGSFLFMGVIGLVIASIINIFTQSSTMDFLISVLGVLIFAGLTAYDHQKLRVMYAGLDGSADNESRAVIMGALTLYLDFINLFLFILRLFGGRSSE